jgi:hypothetical protein
MPISTHRSAVAASEPPLPRPASKPAGEAAAELKSMDGGVGHTLN